MLFTGFTGKYLDVQPQRTILLRRGKDLVNIPGDKFLGNDTFGDILLGVTQNGAYGVQLLLHVSGGFLLRQRFCQLRLQFLCLSGALFVHGKEIRIIQLALGVVGQQLHALLFYCFQLLLQNGDLLPQPAAAIQRLKHLYIFFYGPLIRALGGEVITISASNGSYVNALDISKEYGDGRNPLVLKSEFIMSLCEQLMGAGEIGAKEKSIIDRCTANIYRKYIRKYEGDPPTLKDLYDDLMRQKEPVAHEIALALELFTTGSLNVFAHQTNIDTRNRIICYDIQDLGENLKPIGLLVMLDSILNRVIRNRQQGRYTHVYIDEIYLFFASPGVGGKSAINNYSSEFLYKCWKRFRKYYATLTGITQNVEECLLSDTARLMFANSEFLVLLNQAPTDRAELAKLLDASDAQMDYVSDAPAGHGLIKVGSCLVPFINELPRDTELYRLMTTKPGEQNA